jgi:hypothetical protein
MAGRSVSRSWTESDIEKLRTMAGKRLTRQIAAELDRTIGGIIQKAFDLKLSLTVRPQAALKPSPEELE